MMTDTAGTRTRDRPRRRALGRRGGRHPQGHPPRRGRQRGDRRRAGRHAGPGDPGGPRPAPRLRPLPRAHPDDRHRGHRLLGGGPGPRPGGPPARRPQGSSASRAPPGAAAGEPRIRSEPEPPPAEHRPGADALPVAKTGTGPCEQIRVLPARRRSAMKARARRPPADHRPAGHRPRRRAHPPRTVSAARGLIDALARTRPAPATHRPRIDDRASAAPPGSAATGSRADEITDIDTELRAPTARAAPTMLATKALRRQPPPPCSPAPTDNPGRIRTEASFAALCGAAPIPAGPGRTNRHRLNRGGDRQANREPHTNAPPARRPAHQGPRRPPHRHGQEPQRDTAPPPNAPSPAKHGTRRPAPDPHPAPTTCAEGATNEDSPPAQAAHHLNTHPARISELERGTRPDTTLTAAYRQWLNTQQPQTHTT